MKQHYNPTRLRVGIIVFLTVAGISRLHSQTMKEQWPYDSVKIFSHDLTTAEDDSSLISLVVYVSTTQGHLSDSYRLRPKANSVGFDTLSWTRYYQDEFGRDTLEESYDPSNAQSFLLTTRVRREYWPNGKQKMSETVGFNNSGAPSQAYLYTYRPEGGVILYEASVADSSGTLQVYGRTENQFIGSRHSEQTIWGIRNVNGKDSLLRTNYTKWHLNSDSLRVSKLGMFVPPGFTTLQPNDSTYINYDVDGREYWSLYFKYDKNLDGTGGWAFWAMDTTMYGPGPDDYVLEYFKVWNGGLLLDSRTSFIRNSSFSIRERKSLSSVFNFLIIDTTFFDQAGRIVQLNSWQANNDGIFTSARTRKINYLDSTDYLIWENQYYWYDDPDDANYTSAQYFVKPSFLLSPLIEDVPIRFSLYPNPTHGLIHLQLPEPSRSRIRLFDIQGRIIDTFNAEGDLVPLDFQHLRAGYYFLELEQSGKFSTQKILLAK